MKYYVAILLVATVGSIFAQRNARAGGSRQLAGGWSDQPVSADGVTNSAKFAVGELSKKSNSLFHEKLVNVVSAKSQIVAGTKYEITYTVGRTQCQKNHVKFEEVDNCELDKTHPMSTCTVVVWTRLWLSDKEKYQLLDFKCKDGAEVSRGDNKYHSRLTEHKRLFQSFQRQYKKAYPSVQERTRRFKIFQNNLKRIDLLNQHEQGTAKYGITEHADLSAKEFFNKFLGLKTSLKQDKYKSGAQAEIKRLSDLPESFDWREKGAVTEVKNQGSCGSCWAFSTTGNVEGQWFLKKGQLVSLSEQELVDCDKLDQGCNGGLPSNAYEQIEELGGLEQESDYPYDGKDDTCSFNKQLAKVTISGWANVSSDETDMANYLVQNGPLSIGINANAMQFYFGGISHPPKFLCSPSNLDHGVLIVGYGVHTYPLFKKTMPYWIVKNSWGANWGEQGYYRVYRGDGTCGLNQMVTSSIV